MMCVSILCITQICLARFSRNRYVTSANWSESRQAKCQILDPVSNVQNKQTWCHSAGKACNLSMVLCCSQLYAKAYIDQGDKPSSIRVYQWEDRENVQLVLLSTLQNCKTGSNLCVLSRLCMHECKCCFRFAVSSKLWSAGAYHPYLAVSACHHSSYRVWLPVPGQETKCLRYPQPTSP